MNTNARHILKKLSLTMATLGVFLVLSVVSHAEYYAGNDAQQVLNGACIRTTTVTNPLTGVVEQALCRCVARFDARGTDATGNPWVLVTLGPETTCAPPPATPQQQAAAQHRIADIDTALAQWHNYLQNLGQYCDPWAYYNDPTYKAECDAWMVQEGTQGQWYVNQLQAERNSLVSVAQAGPVPVAPGGVPGPAGPGGGGNPGVPPGANPAPAGPQGGGAVPPSGSGILGQRLPDEP